MRSMQVVTSTPPQLVCMSGFCRHQYASQMLVTVEGLDMKISVKLQCWKTNRRLFRIFYKNFPNVSKLGGVAQFFFANADRIVHDFTEHRPNIGGQGGF
jgi:hypothetical protein